jgi:hypothetical protein
MRKIAMMGGAVLAAALFAQGVQAQSAAQERREAADATREEARQEGREARDTVRQEGREARDSARQEGREARQGARQEGRQAREGAQARASFEDADNFDIEGKVQKVSKNSITVEREEMPPATLTISQHTKVELDGERATAQQLKQGQEVKASFNLRGDKAEAVEIKAEKTEQQERQQERRQSR